jgi:hypothetical protein
MTRKVFPQRVRSHRHCSTVDLPARSLGDPIETGGEFFAGGRSVSLILDPSTHRLKLLLSDGEAEQIESISVVPKRDGQGYCLQLTDALCRRIHKLARQFDVAAVQEGSEACPYCGENSAEKTEIA